MSYPELPVLGFIAAALVLIPLPWHVRTKNIVTIAIIFWLFSHCFISATNAIIWAGNVHNSAPLWCDITIKVRAATPIALSAATLCLCKHLEFISSRRPMATRPCRVSQILFELVMCFGLPCVWMFVSYCFQSFRFIILENLGCFPGYFHSYSTYAVLFGPPLLLSLITLVYGCIAIYHLVEDRRVLHSQPLKSWGAGLSNAQYYRLMSMGMMMGVWGIVWITLEVQQATRFGSFPLPDWQSIHKDISIVIELPTVLDPKLFATYRLMWWAIPGAAYLAAAFFCTSRDAIYEYHTFWMWLRTKIVGRTLPGKAELTAMPPFSESDHSYRHYRS